MKHLKILVLFISFTFIASTNGYSKHVKNLKEIFTYQKKLDLFTISSSILPDSEIKYSIVLDNNYNIINKSPVISYRHYLASNNYRKLNWAERTQAYGIKAQLKNSGDSCAMYLDQYPELKISIFIKDKKAYPLVRINNQVMVLETIKAKANEGLFGVPDVEYVDIIGYDPRTKKRISKRIHHED